MAGTTDSAWSQQSGSAQSTTASGASEGFTPLPRPVAGSSKSTRRRSRRHRKSWYRRPLYVVPIAILALFAVATGVVAFRTMSAFDSVHSVSTPPPELSGAALGGSDTIVIDTGPAQEVVRQRQEQVREQDNVVAPDEGEPPLATAPSKNTPDPANVAVAPVSTPEVAASAGGTNILLMGVDARSGDSIDIGVRPDSLAVLHLDEETGSCRVLSIPRDSRVELPGYGMSKINHALAVGGIPYEQQVVEQYLGIEIDHYGLIDFSGLTKVVDAVDGVTVDNPEAFSIGGQQFESGAIELDGERAVLYARYRGGSDGDFGRISGSSRSCERCWTRQATRTW